MHRRGQTIIACAAQGMVEPRMGLPFTRQHLFLLTVEIERSILSEKTFWPPALNKST